MIFAGKPATAGGGVQLLQWSAAVFRAACFCCLIPLPGDPAASTWRGLIGKERGGLEQVISIPKALLISAHADWFFPLSHRGEWRAHRSGRLSDHPNHRQVFGPEPILPVILSYEESGQGLPNSPYCENHLECRWNMYGFLPGESESLWVGGSGACISFHISGNFYDVAGLGWKGKC